MAIQFVAIKNFDSYVISNESEVYSTLKSNINDGCSIASLKQFLRNGYLSVCLVKDKKKYFKSIHRLVAEAFIDNPENKPAVNHIDGNKENNNISNLEWVTFSENIKHAYVNNLIKPLTHTLEHKIKTSKLMKDKAKKVLCVDDDLLFNCVSDAAEYYGCNKSSIHRVISGKRKALYGRVFKYWGQA